MVRISGTALAAAVATAVLTGMAATPATAGPADPAGTCRPTADHPYPVVLLHGTMDDASAWNVLAPNLTAAGYCVFAPSYGQDSSSLPYGGIAPIARAAVEVATYIDGVLARTGAARVDIVGHSQGGTIAEYYAKNLGQARHVHTELLLAPGTHGTTLSGLVGLVDQAPAVRSAVDSEILPAFCAACADLEVGSTFMNTLDDGPIAQPGVHYAVLATRDDTTVTPAGPASFIDEPGVTNQFVQDLRPGSVAHQHLPLDAAVGRWVLDQLGSGR